MRLLRQLVARMKDQWDRQATLHELRQLSSRQLRDIGIEPYQIVEVVDGMLKARSELAECSAHAPLVRGRGTVREPRTWVCGGALPVQAPDRCC